MSGLLYISNYLTQFNYDTPYKIKNITFLDQISFHYIRDDDVFNLYKKENNKL